MDLASILAAVGVLALVIFVHELGHFSVAKLCDVEVRCFSMGFGPTLFSRTWGETEYRLAAIPFGGYVRMAGDDDEEDPPLNPERGFTAKSVARRSAIIAAGPIANLALAVVFFAIVAYFWGFQLPSDEPIVGGFIAGTPAESSDFRIGDRVTAFDGGPIENWAAFVTAVVESGGREIVFTVTGTDGEVRTVAVTPAMSAERDSFGEVIAERYKLGIDRHFERHDLGALGSLTVGFRYTWYYSGMVIRTVGRLLQGRLAMRDLGGPIMIAQVATKKAQRGIESLLAFVALISVNLGIINVLPIPILDGGHLLFLFLERLRGQPLSLRVRELALQAGIVLIGFLMIFVVVNDIFRIVSG